MLNLGSFFMTMRHVCLWQHQSTSEKIMGIEETPDGVYFFVAKVSHWARKCPCLNCWHYAVLIRQAGHKISCFTEKSVRYARPVGWKWMPHRCRGTLGNCSGSQLFLSLLTFFGSHLLALPAYSVNIISFLGLWGSWRLDSYSFPCLPDAESKLW